MKKDYKPLPPFKWFVLQNFPFIDEDFDAMTNYEVLCKVVEYLNKTIDAVNSMGEEVNALQEWFDNLDVQDEVDKKLDEMAESGELASVIAEFLNSACVFAFKTVQEMSESTALSSGAIARTLGIEHYYDGDGDFYYIRPIQNTDVVDGVKKVALVNPELIAVRIVSAQITEINNAIDDIEEDVGDLQDAVSSISGNKVILVGDSYATYYQSELQQLLGVANADWYNYSVGGAGFVSNGSNTYYNNLTSNDSAITDKTKVKAIIFAGGWNDRGHVSDNSIETAMSTLFTYVKTNYPNAKIYCGMLANTKDIDDTAGSIYWRNSIQNNLIPKYKKCIDYGAQYLTGVEQVMHNYTYFDSDNVHPNSDGGSALAKAISQAIKSGYYAEDGKTKYININNSTTGLTLNETNVTSSTNFAVTTRIKNGVCYFTPAGDIYINNKNTSNQQLSLDIATYTNDYTATRYVNQGQIAFEALAYNNTNFYPVYGGIAFKRDGNVRLTITCNQNITGIRRILFVQNTKVLPIDFM